MDEAIVFLLPASFMARHFILEAVKHHSIDFCEGIEIDPSKTTNR